MRETTIMRSVSYIGMISSLSFLTSNYAFSMKSSHHYSFNLTELFRVFYFSV